ncbi:MAG: protein-export chaperone SecB [Sediminibacterium sp.]|nr:protein-export chaperone SecB [Sediminibacterium sp.]
MEIKEQISLRFKGISFPSVQLVSSKPYVENEENAIKIDIQPKAFIPSDSPNEFQIIMNVELSAEGYFNLKITGIGSFELSDENVTPEIRKSYINANSTAIVFPYVRAFIATLSANLGNVTTPILLPTRFFKGDYIEEENTEE